MCTRRLGVGPATRRLLCRGFVCALVLSGAAVAFAGQAGPAEGLVVDASTGKPVAGVNVAIVREDKAQVVRDPGETEANGHYRIITPIVRMGVSASFNVLKGLGGLVAGSTLSAGIKDRVFSSFMVTWEDTPIKNAPPLYFYTQLFSVRVEKPGYKPFDGELWAYDFNASCKVGFYGTKPGWAKLDTVVLAPEGSAVEARADGPYLALSDLTLTPQKAAQAQPVKVAVRYTPSPDQQRCGGTVVALFSRDTEQIRLDLRELPTPSGTAPGSVEYAGELKLDKRFRPGDYVVHVLGLGRPRGKRQQDMSGAKGSQLAARNVLQGSLTVE